MSSQNGDFMYHCEICGCNELALSEINIRCGYGSKYDGEELKLSVCGDCMDKIYADILLYSEAKNSTETEYNF